MSPVITGNAHAAVHNHAHVDLPARRPSPDLDPYEALERARARRAVRSPIRVPEGGWAGPEPGQPVPATKTTKTTKARAKRRTTVRPEQRTVVDAIERRNELAQQWEKFKALAANGHTAQQIATELNIKVDRVRRDAKAAGITLTRGKSTGAPIHWDIALGTRLAEQGMTAREIGEQVGASPITVRRVLGRHGVTLTDGRAKYSGGQNSLKRRGDVDPKAVRDLYLEHGNATHVARLIGCSPQTVTRILHDEGLTVRSSGDVQKGRPGADRAAPLKALMREHGTDAVEVRTWGAAHGYDVARNGIPPRAVVDAYLQAHTTTEGENQA